MHTHHPPPTPPAPPPAPAAAHSADGTPTPLTEQQVMEGFHAFLKGALSQAHAERLLTDDMLASAEADLMVEGPALCLFFAALRSASHPPSVILPAPSAPHSAPLILDITTCPATFRPLFRLWSSTVQPIKSLPSQYQHDLARLICDLDPLSSPVRESLPRLAGELRAVAIEISQRRTFQERYGSDLQAVLDRTGAAGRVSASFAPPPAYEAAAPEKQLPPTPSPARSSSRSPPPPPSPRSGAQSLQVPQQQRPAGQTLEVPQTPPARPGSPSTPSSPYSQRPPSPLHARFPSSPRTPPSPSLSALPSPSTPSPILALIRETLYASLADVLALTPSLALALQQRRDPAQTYFASVALAILHVCLTSISSDGEVRGVLDQRIREADVPEDYRAFMSQLVRIALRAQLMGEEDDARAVRYAAQGRELPTPRLDRLRKQLLEGAGAGVNVNGDGVLSGRPTTPSGTVTAVANRINVVALQWTRLRAFRERQGEVFAVLAAVGRH